MARAGIPAMFKHYHVFRTVRTNNYLLTFIHYLPTLVLVPNKPSYQLIITIKITFSNFVSFSLNMTNKNMFSWFY